jgi:hypothetical protein
LLRVLVVTDDGVPMCGKALVRGTAAVHSPVHHSFPPLGVRTGVNEESALFCMAA